MEQLFIRTPQLRRVILVLTNNDFPELEVALSDVDIAGLISDAFENFSEEVDIQYWPEAHELDGTLQLGGWIDLYTYEDVELKAGDFKLIPLGVAMRLPEMYEAILAPRSSTFKNWGILQANSIGVIDNSYSGPNDMWKLAVYATRTVFIPKDTRLCQFRIQPMQLPIKFHVVERLDGEDRNGFGSTGL